MRLADYIGARRAQIDEALTRFLPSPPVFPRVLYDAMRYSLDAGGKRLRPILTLAAAEAVARTHRPPRAQSSSPCRRRAPSSSSTPTRSSTTISRQWTTTRCGGVVPRITSCTVKGWRFWPETACSPKRSPCSRSSRATRISPRERFARFKQSQAPRGRPAWSAGRRLTCSRWARRHSTSTPCRICTRARPGRLIRAAAVAGAIMGGGGNDAIAAVDEYGRHLGLAFQIVDDILDVEGDAKDLGKTAGKDAKAGKPTYPSTYGLDESRRLAAARHDDAIAALRSAGLAESRARRHRRLGYQENKLN